MKLTLHNPPEGYEAEADYRHSFGGEAILNSSGGVGISKLGAYSVEHIVLTPKKRKYWRLDPVATFEEATPASNYVSLRCGHLDREIGSWPSNVAGVQWLRVTECEE